MKKLGELLLESGLINQAQLLQAIQRMETTGGRLGTNLIEMMLIDEITLGNFLSKQVGIPAINPMVLDRIEPEVLKTMPSLVAGQYHIIPFKLEGKRLHAAMLNPADIRIIDELSRRLGYILKPYICSEQVIYRALNKHYNIAPPLRSRDETELEDRPDIIVHDTSGIISLDDSGQFTLVDRTDLLGKNTKKLFLEATTRTAIIGYFLQFLGYTSDRVAFLAYDSGQNFLWRDPKSFQEGQKGLALGEQINRSQFWVKFLKQPVFFYSRLPRPGNEMAWAGPMLDLPDPKALFMAPCQLSKTSIGIAIGGATSVYRIEEELETIKKLHLMAVSSLKINELKKIIETIT